MRYLLDTHTLLWLGSCPERIGKDALAACRDRESVLHVSIASLWEITIKFSLGKLKLPSPLGQMFSEVAEHGFVLLAIKPNHLLQLSQLPWHHRDPFDRLIIAQSISEAIPVLSKDEVFDAYDVRRVW